MWVEKIWSGLVEEAHELRKRGIKGYISSGRIFTEEAEMILEDGLTPVVSSRRNCRLWKSWPEKQKIIPFI